MIALYELTNVWTADSIAEVLGPGGETVTVAGPLVVVRPPKVSVTPAIAPVTVFVDDVSV